MMAERPLDVAPLISHRFAIDDAASGVRRSSTAPSRRSASCSNIRRRRSETAGAGRRTALAGPAPRRLSAGDGRVGVAFIGAGNYATAVLIPAFQRRRRATRCDGLEHAVSSGVHAGTQVRLRARRRPTRTRSRRRSRSTPSSSPRGTTSHAALVAARAARRQARVRREAAGADAATSSTRIEAAYRRGRRKRHGAAAHGRLQPPLRAADRAHRRACCARCARAEGVRHDGQRRRDPARATGRRIRRSAAAASSAKPATSSTCCGFSPARLDRRHIAALRWRAPTGDTVQHLAHVRRRLDRHDPLPRQRQQERSRRSGSRCLRRAACCSSTISASLRGFGWPGFKTMNLWRQDKGQRACAAGVPRRHAATAGTAPIPFDELVGGRPCDDCGA